MVWVEPMQVISEARAGGYAVGAFNMHSEETTEALVQAAEQAASPGLPPGRPGDRPPHGPATRVRDDQAHRRGVQRRVCDPLGSRAMGGGLPGDSAGLHLTHVRRRAPPVRGKHPHDAKGCGSSSRVRNSGRGRAWQDPGRRPEGGLERLLHRRCRSGAFSWPRPVWIYLPSPWASSMESRCRTPSPWTSSGSRRLRLSLTFRWYSTGPRVYQSRRSGTPLSPGCISSTPIPICGTRSGQGSKRYGRGETASLRRRSPRAGTDDCRDGGEDATLRVRWSRPHGGGQA